MKNKVCYRHDDKSCLLLHPTLTKEDNDTTFLFNKIKSKASADALIEFVEKNLKTKTISNRTAALLIRGALIDFGGGSMYDTNLVGLIKLMKGLGKWNFMYHFEREIFKSFQSDELNIYRAGIRDSVFWTLSKVSAEIHFGKHKELNFIWSGTIKKDKVIFFAHFDNGLIVCDPQDIKNVTKLAIPTLQTQ